MIRAGLIFFVVVTLLASFMANVIYAVNHPTDPGQFRFISSEVIWLAHTLMVSLVTLPAVIIMMIAGWLKTSRPVLVGVVAIVGVVAAIYAMSYLEIVLSTNEVRRNRPMDPPSLYLVGLGCILVAYGLAYAMLRRTGIMRPLLVASGGAVQPAAP